MRLLLAGFIILMLSASALAEMPNGNCTTVSIGNYGAFSFCVPGGVSIRPDTGGELGYAGGREASTSLWLNDKMVQVYLIYPCDRIGSWLDLQGLRSRLETFNPLLRQSAVYYNSPITVDGHPAIWGNWNNLGVKQEFIIYQPASSVLGAVFFNADIPYEVRNSFLGSLRMSINEGLSPLRYSDCPQTPAPVPVKVYEPRVIYYGWDHHGPFNDNSSPQFPSHRWSQEWSASDELDASIKQLNEENQAIHDELQASRETLLGFSGLGYKGVETSDPLLGNN